MNSDSGTQPVVKPPFSIRRDPEQRQKWFALQQGVPPGLLPSLRDWTIAIYFDSGNHVLADARLKQLELRANRQITSDDNRSSQIEFEAILTADPILLIDAADLALKWADVWKAMGLEESLVTARSAYCVKTDDQKNYELQLRQSEEMVALIENEANQSGHAATHLRNAWSKCFGLNPDTKGACIEAVSAVEVAAKPIISPDNSRTTLGTLCRDMEAKPSKWETDSEYVASVEAVLNMMKLVWNEGHYRHGDDRLPLEVSQESAEMTVQTAVLLVSWFRSERIRLKQ